MARQCMRPGCDRPAAARLTYDTVVCAVWLDPPEDGPEPMQVVCGIHAATLTAPRGWTVTDRRRPTEAVDVVATPPGRRRSEKAAPASAEPPPETLAEALAASVDAPPASVAPAESAATAEESADETVEEKAKPGARVRRRSASATRRKLLDRAFEQSGPQRSVLTDRPADDSD